MEKSQKNKTVNKTDWTSVQSYTSYIFQSFLKRPFGYIISILYLAYLATILLIVPAAKHLEPLFIWNIGGFNISIFNLLFISVAAASIAVCIFRTGREDGSDLVFSSKPLTKTWTVLIKTFVFATIILVLCILSLIIVALIKPIFGVYDEISNPTGIAMNKYTSLMISMFVANITNLLLFGGIAVFITLFGSQVITMIITFGVAFLMCLVNFLGPLATRSNIAVIEEKTNSQVLSYSLPTLNQIMNGEDEFKRYATIQCYCTDSGESRIFDTNKYWMDSRKEAKQDGLNYVDFGKQLSMLYSSFGLTESNLIEASKMPIGTNKSYRYDTDASTHVSEQLKTKEYPIAIYTLTEDRGKTFPKIYTIGGDINLSSDNWYLKSKILNLNFNTINFLGLDLNDESPSILKLFVYKLFENKVWFKPSEMIVSPEQIDAVIGDDENSTYNLIIQNCARNVGKESSANYSNLMLAQVKLDQRGILFPTDSWDNLSWKEKYAIMAKVQLLITIKSQQEQLNSIAKYCEDEGIKDAFPYSSNTIIKWFNAKAQEEEQEFYWKQYVAEWNMKKGILIGAVTPEGGQYTEMYAKNLCSSIKYSETFGNLYQYSIHHFYSIWAILGSWIGIAILLFSSAIIVYKKIDLK